LRALPFVLLALFLLIQHPLWIGNGGWLRVWELDRQLSNHAQGNDLRATRNNALAAEVQDLQQGHHAVEERARYELGMIGPDEIFVQINEMPPGQRANSPATNTAFK
jgi:cell division protein FtsB